MRNEFKCGSASVVWAKKPQAAFSAAQWAHAMPHFASLFAFGEWAHFCFGSRLRATAPLFRFAEKEGGKNCAAKCTGHPCRGKDAGLR